MAARTKMIRLDNKKKERRLEHRTHSFGITKKHRRHSGGRIHSKFKPSHARNPFDDLLHPRTSDAQLVGKEKKTSTAMEAGRAATAHSSPVSKS